MGDQRLNAEEIANKKRKRNDAIALIALFLFTCFLFGRVFFMDGAQVLGKPEGDGRTQFFCWRVYGSLI